MCAVATGMIARACSACRRIGTARSSPRRRSARPIDVDAVVLATGMFDTPVRPTLLGLPADGPADGARPRVVHAGAWRIADARAGGARARSATGWDRRRRRG